MKYLISIISVLFIVLNTNAQFKNNETRNLKDFNQIKVSGNVKATLIKSDSNYIKLSSHVVELGTVTTEVDKSMLTVSNLKLTEENEVIVNIYYKTLDYLAVKAGGNAKVEGIIKKEFFEVDVQNGSILHIDFDVDNLVLTIANSSDCISKGKCKTADIKLNAGSKLFGKKLKIENLEIDVNTGSLARVAVSNDLDAKASVKGELYYYGEPKTLNQKANLGGLIKKGD